jgi:phage-related protein
MFTLQTFWLDTKTSEDDEVVSWSLSSPADLQGLLSQPTNHLALRMGAARAVPERRWLHLQRHGVFRCEGNAVADPALDVCGGCLSDCRKRFGAGLAEPNAAILDFGGFPATVLFSR